MIIVSHSELEECVQKLDDCVHLIMTMEDVCIGEGLDTIYEVKQILNTYLDSSEDPYDD